jgi:hypothetical protein
MANVMRRVLRRGLGAVRSVGPATVAVALSLIIGAAGFADAATGGTFILGRSNAEQATATLSDSKGTPLLLQAPAGKAPLAVNRSVQVRNLNAEYVGGKTAAQLESNGGAGMTITNEGIPLSPQQIQIVSTGPLPAGTYAVTATAFMDALGDQAICYLSATGGGGNASTALSYGGGTSTGLVQATETAVVTVAAKAIVSEWCYGSTGQSVLNAGVTATRVDSVSWGTLPIKFGPRLAAKSQRP